VSAGVVILVVRRAVAFVGPDVTWAIALHDPADDLRHGVVRVALPILEVRAARVPHVAVIVGAVATMGAVLSWRPIAIDVPALIALGAKPTPCVVGAFPPSTKFRVVRTGVGAVGVDGATERRVPIAATSV
jgi:hypothetical protein